MTHTNVLFDLLPNGMEHNKFQDGSCLMWGFRKAPWWWIICGVVWLGRVPRDTHTHTHRHTYVHRHIPLHIILFGQVPTFWASLRRPLLWEPLGARGDVLISVPLGCLLRPGTSFPPRVVSYLLPPTPPGLPALTGLLLVFISFSPCTVPDPR